MDQQKIPTTAKLQPHKGLVSIPYPNLPTPGHPRKLKQGVATSPPVAEQQTIEKPKVIDKPKAVETPKVVEKPKVRSIKVPQATRPGIVVEVDPNDYGTPPATAEEAVTRRDLGAYVSEEAGIDDYQDQTPRHQ